jgi:putative FmdB family regulatory protein
MPTYEYRCATCKHEFEQFQSIMAEPLRKCPQCGKLKLQRLMGTGGGIIFRGSGFYQTDYRSESYKKAAEADKSGGKSSGDTKTAENKPAKSEKTEKSETKTKAERKAG